MRWSVHLMLRIEQLFVYKIIKNYYKKYKKGGVTLFFWLYFYKKLNLELYCITYINILYNTTITITW